jgi:hypothetical protein
VNVTIVEDSATKALVVRTAFNSNLLLNSWLYVGCISGFFFIFALTALWKELPLRWRYIFIENIVLVALLGAYEWMFFSTIVLKYQSISIAELDSQIFSKFQALC